MTRACATTQYLRHEQVIEAVLLQPGQQDRASLIPFSTVASERRSARHPARPLKPFSIAFFTSKHQQRKSQHA
jgi:hypothetical protein